MEKKLNAGKTKFGGPKTVRELYSFLDEQDRQKNGDTWIYWNVKGREIKAQPYFVKTTPHTVEMQLLQSSTSECSVYSLLKAVKDILDDYVLEDNKKDKYFVFKYEYDDKAYEIGSITKTMQRLEFNMIDWGMDEAKTLVDEIFDQIDECEGGCACGGNCGGDCGGNCGGGDGGISTGDVLGPDGNFENGKGSMGPGDFHVPFPVMPCLVRWPTNWLGGNAKKRRKKNMPKAATGSNPYAKGMKTIVAEDEDSVQVFEYQGFARQKFEEITQDVDNVFTGVLTFNRRMRLAWLINDKGFMEFYKPIRDWDEKTHEPIPGGKWRIYHTRLDRNGEIELLDISDMEYGTEDAALNAVFKAVQEHRQKLTERLEKKIEESRPDPRELIKWIAQGKDPARFPMHRPEIDARRLENEIRMKFPHQFENVKLSNAAGRWTLEFTAEIPEGQSELRGQTRVSAAVPMVNRIVSFLRTRGVDVNSYDVTAVER